jgi:hypothetical protein
LGRLILGRLGDQNTKKILIFFLFKITMENLGIVPVSPVVFLLALGLWAEC